MNSTENNRVFLAHWTYSTEEWTAFLQWTKMRQGKLSYFLFLLFNRRTRRVPEIAITHHKVWIGDEVHSFRDTEKHLKQIHIREAGNLNILQIRFIRQEGKRVVPDQIFIPIPKGKLREAIQVHESLSVYAW